jgi:hypothetical protein
MNWKKVRSVLILLLALSMVLTLNANVYANNQQEPRGRQQEEAPLDRESQNPLRISSMELQKENAEKIAAVTAELKESMVIESVEILTAPEIQSKYREDMYKEGGKYYTTFRDASMLDPRNFTIKATFSSENFEGIGTEPGMFDVSKVTWWYGDGLAVNTGSNKPIAGTGSWTKANFGGSGSANPIVVQGTPAVVDNQDGTYSLTAVIKFDVCYNTVTNINTNPNTPYVPYANWAKRGLDILYSLLDKLNNATLRMVYDDEADKPLAAMKLKYNIRDYYHTWKEYDDYIKNTVLPQSNNAGDGTFAKKGRYLQVQSLGKSTGYNNGNELGGGPPVRRDLWNAVLADSKASIDYYANVVQPKMMKDPTSLDPKDPNFRMVIYFNNNHSDETAGMDAIIMLMKTLSTSDAVSYKTTEDVTRVGKSGSSTYGYNKINPDASIDNIDLNVDELLKKFIFVFTFAENPDGRFYGSRRTAYGFDPNRDSAYQTQGESQYSKGAIAKWDPLAMLEFHGHYYELMLEPCTAPHDPNFEYDLLQPKMLNLAHKLAKGAITEGAFNRYSIALEDYNSSSGSFDDGSAMYSPIFAMHYGTLGFTYETPNGNIEDVLMMQKASFAMLGEIYDNYNEYVANKLEYKRRGVAHEDRATDVDPYFTTYEGDPVGRPREEGKNYFPDYYVIPVDNINQKNVLEAYKMVKYLTRNQVLVEKTTEEVNLGGRNYPAGTFLVDMRQGNRGIANVVLAQGFDASTFKTRPYAELVINFPDLRGFDAIPVHNYGAFSGKTTAANNNSSYVIANENSIVIPPAVLNGSGDMVIVKNNSIDTVKMVVKALQNNAEVNMLVEDVWSKGTRGDFYMTKANFDQYKEGLLVEAVAVSALASKAYKALTMPKFRVYGSPDESAFVFELMGFRRGVDFNYGAISGMNAIVGFNDGTNVAASLASGIGYVGIGINAVEAARTNNYLGTGLTVANRSSGSGGNPRFEGVVRGSYDDNSIITANYDRMERMYTVNSYYITGIPSKARALMRVAADTRTQNTPDMNSFFIAGWSYNNKQHIQNSILAVSGTYQGSDSGAPVTLFASNIINKAHNQSQYNMLANAIFAAAAKINPNQLEKPHVSASVKPEVRWLGEPVKDIRLTFRADGTSAPTGTVTASKYKVTQSSVEPVYSPGDSSWKEYSEAIDLEGKGQFYIHYYAENSAGEKKQGYFGPYKLDVGPVEISSLSYSDLSHEGVTLSVRANAVSGITGYRWQYKKLGSTDWNEVLNNSPTLRVTGLEVKEEYVFRVAVANNVGVETFLSEGSELKLKIPAVPVAITTPLGNMEAWKLNSTIPLKFNTFNKDGKQQWVEEVKVKVISNDKVAATYEMGKGADSVRQAGGAGMYMVNINTQALKLKEGSYKIVIEFKEDAAVRTYTSTFVLN